MKQIFIYILLSIILALALLFGVDQCQRKQLWKENYEAESNINEVKNIYLTKSEMKEYLENNQDYLLDTISKLVNFKVTHKNINEITNLTYQYEVTDTIKLAPEPEKTYLTFNYDAECWGFSAYLYDSTFYLTKKYFNTESKIIDFWKRRPLWNINKLPRWGKKEAFRETLDKCSGDITIEKIMAKKRP